MYSMIIDDILQRLDALETKMTEVLDRLEQLENKK